jgi:hypothetical protein
MKPLQELHNGDKVRINVHAFDWQKNELTDKFIDYMNRNEDTIFTAKHERGQLWTFEEDDMWLFWVNNLIKV